MFQWVEDVSPAVDKVSSWRTIVGVALSFTGFMLITVATRFWLRRRRLQAEDWITVVTALFSVVYNVGTIVQTRYGLGLPLRMRSHATDHSYILWNYSIRPFYLLGIAGFKIALCVSYIRLTRSVMKHYRRYIIVLAVFCGVAQLIFMFFNLIPCLPYEKTLHHQIKGTCLPYGSTNYVISGVTIACDVAVFLAPIPLINRLRLERIIRIGLMLTFSLGLITTICSILRMLEIWRIAYGDGNSSYLVLYGAVELNIGIITSSLPVLRPILKHIPRRIMNAFNWRLHSETTIIDTNPEPYPFFTLASRPAPKKSPMSTTTATVTTVTSGDVTSGHCPASSNDAAAYDFSTVLSKHPARPAVAAIPPSSPTSRRSRSGVPLVRWDSSVAADATTTTATISDVCSDDDDDDFEHAGRSDSCDLDERPRRVPRLSRWAGLGISRTVEVNVETVETSEVISGIDPDADANVRGQVITSAIEAGKMV